jgi:hypothetical protein
MDALSICIGCAKHSSLKRFVRDNGTPGHECGICHRSDLIASVPAKYEALSSLIRALIRFYYDEWTYNGHWGGNQEPQSLLCHENEIIEHASVPGFARSAETSEGFLVELMLRPKETDLSNMTEWEEGFFSSRFTHPSGIGTLTRHVGGFMGLWTELAGENQFPETYLVGTRQTLLDFAKEN